jgi:hypothetical protein
LSVSNTADATLVTVETKIPFGNIIPSNGKFNVNIEFGVTFALNIEEPEAVPLFKTICPVAVELFAVTIIALNLIDGAITGVVESAAVIVVA